MKIYSIFLLMPGILLNLVKFSAAETNEEKVESLEARVNAVEKRSAAIIQKIEDIGTKMAQLLKAFQETIGGPDEKKAVDGTEVVIVTGGVGFYGYVSKETGSVAKSTELYIPETGKSCFFKDLPNERNSHTLDTVENTAVLCGEGTGRYTNCLQYTPSTPEGAWSAYGRTEGGSLQHHSSWVSSAGLVLLGGRKYKYIRGGISGSSHNKDTEIVPGGGRSFDLKWGDRQTCSIQFDDYFILTGGFSYRNHVIQYNLQGYVKTLPSLNEDRYDHACGKFSANGKTVMIVAGGEGSTYKPISSTETLLTRDSAWTTVAPLPKVLSKMAFVSMGQYFLVLGGESANAVTDIYKFDGEVWTEAGKLNAPRYGPAATVVRSNELAELCK